MLQTQPNPVPVGTPVTVTVAAKDETTAVPVDGEVIVDDSNVISGGRRRVIGRTNSQITYTFRSKTQREFDATIKKWIEWKVYPVGTVLAPGYGETEIDWGFRN